MLTEDVRQAMRRSGLSGKQLAQQAGVPQPVVCKFLNGADAMGTTLDRLCNFLGLKLQQPKKPKKGRG